MSFISRWKSGGIEVKPSEHGKEAWVWEWAIKYLRPAGMQDDEKAEAFIRKEGEVIEVRR